MTPPTSQFPPSLALREILRAQWRTTFETLGLRFTETPSHIRLSVNSWWRADFYLPSARQHVIVRPEPDEHDELLHRIVHPRLSARPHVGETDYIPDLPIIIAGLDGGLWAVPRGDERLVSGVALYRCARCREWWFLDDDMGWTCQSCGHYEGSRTMDRYVGGNTNQQLADDFPLVRLPESWV